MPSFGRPDLDLSPSWRRSSHASRPLPRPRPAARRPPPEWPPPRRAAAGTPAADAPSAGNLTLLSAQVTPRKSFYYGIRFPSLRYSIGSDQPQNDLRIDVVDGAGEVMTSFYRNDIAPGVEDRVRWSGTTVAGRPAPQWPLHVPDRPPDRRAGPAAGAAARPFLRSAADQPRLLALRLRLPAAGVTRFRRRRRAIRSRPLRPHPRGPGHHGEVRAADRRRPRRHGSSTRATRAPPATTSSSTAAGPATTWPTCT